MIITRTPLRISFFGGGTDLRAFYKKDYGAVIGSTINKYVNVIINKRFESTVRASYSKTEIVNSSSEIKHELIRESLLYAGVNNGVEVVTIADVPGKGTGLGSSSSTLVGLINGLCHYAKKQIDKEALAESACTIEIDKLGNPIGKQDQYFAAYGGLCYIRFNNDESVYVEKLNLNNNTIDGLQENLICFYTGIPRNSTELLTEQKNRIKNNDMYLRELRNLADSTRDLLRNDDLMKFGELLDKGWKIKKNLLPAISNDLIDSYYDRAIRSGALGGKINGAGGGGFLTFYCEKRHQAKVREALRNLKELEIRLEQNGSSLIYEI